MRCDALRPTTAALAILFGLAATPALAHVGTGDHVSFMHGFAHPLGGLDHLAAMIAVGLWAGIAGGRRVWAWPLAFVVMMVVGGLLGRAGVALPMVEPAIALSVVVLGLLVALMVQVPVALGAALVAAFAIFHGHAHGAEAPETGWLGYAAGFIIATALLHTVGNGIARLMERGASLIPVRAIGAATAVLGVVLLVK
jgi:urease accessory protein